MRDTISFKLNSYQVLFSDFDPRPHSERGLADDFLHELQNASLETIPDHPQIIFYLPAHLRDTALEHIIVERLHTHFKKYEQSLSLKRKKTIWHGAALTVAGMLLMAAAVVVSWDEGLGKTASLLRVFLEPTGWFMGWYGLDHIFYIAQEDRDMLAFYQKITGSKIIFVNKEHD